MRGDVLAPPSAGPPLFLEMSTREKKSSRLVRFGLTVFAKASSLPSSVVIIRYLLEPIRRKLWTQMLRRYAIGFTNF